MNVFLTVDVETYGGDYQTDVWAEGLGLPYLLETLKVHGLRASFFIEALGAHRWGVGSVERICSAVLSNGHDVQLHLHPVIAAAWGVPERGDRLWAYDLATQTELIGQAREALAQCVGYPATVFRAGDLAANDDTLRAMRSHDMWLGSNRDLDNRASIASRLNEGWGVANDLAGRDGVLDLPVSCFISPFPWLDGRWRHLQITAVGSREMRYVLANMARAGYRTATVLAHPGEFFVKTPKGLAPNTKNRRRWESLLEWLKAGTWSVSSVSTMNAVPGVERTVAPIRGSLGWAAVRLCQQAVWRSRGGMGYP